jgi:hypothetical protein
MIKQEYIKEAMDYLQMANNQGSSETKADFIYISVANAMVAQCIQNEEIIKLLGEIKHTLLK